MELWIRSQDRMALTKINSIGIEYDKSLVGYGKVCVKLGEYDTKERALEVLDDIENFLLRDLEIINSSYQNADIEIKSKSYVDDCKIYEMPKE